MLLGSILLALAWAALQGDFSLQGLGVGYVLGYLVLFVLGRGGVLPARLSAKLWYAISLAGFFAWEILLANVRVAADVVNPARSITPAVVAVPLDVTSDGEILLLSALINITPGSVTIDLSDDRRTLYVHVMHMVTPEQTRHEIKSGFERRVQQLFN
jgi:multicomponent Na+:H+ antiporter subunit E